MGRCTEALSEHAGLAARRSSSAKRLERVTQAFASNSFLRGLPITVFCAGSLARQEIGAKSDLDLFVTADQDATDLRSRLFEYTLFAELIAVNRELGFPEFSNDGQYLRLHFLDELITVTGSPRDDSDNRFTTRMLLVLESEPLLHRGRYDTHLRKVLSHYYRDNTSKRSFRPLFLLNDILRYWRTLCLNYEERRADPRKPWRKKNVNLKFSRMVTVFSTVLPLVLRPIESASDLFDLCGQSPLERLAAAVDWLGDEKLQAQWPEVLDLYEEFLVWKDDEDVEKYLEGGEQKEVVQRRARTLSEFLYAALTHDRIQPALRRYLVL